MKNLFDAFISYGRADSKAFATKLHARLLEVDLNVWFDQNDIPLGVDFQNQIDDGIEKAHNFIFIIAPHSVKSAYCLKEIQLAVKRNKRIIPLLHVEPSDCWDKMHPTIGKINWVYFREEQDDFEAAFSGLISLIRAQADYAQQHTQILAKALEWQRNQKQNSYLLIGEERQKAESWLKIRFKDDQPPCVPTDLHCEFISESTKNANNLMTQVFLCYSDKDKEVMKKLAKTLRREGFTVWANKTDIKTGTEFQEEVNKGIEGADNVVCLISPAALQSWYWQQEVAHAFANNKRIIPLLIEPTALDSIHPNIRALQFIDFTTHQDEAKYRDDADKLVKILHQDECYYEEHKILLVKALKWQEQNRNRSILLRGHNLQYYEDWLKVHRHRSEHPPLPLQVEFITSSSNQLPESSLEVFISYSRADSDFARKLNEALQIQGKTTWFDQESIPPGSDFQQEIYRGIESSANFVFIISPRSVNSPYCADEVEYARKLNKRLVTVLHTEVSAKELHPALASVQWIDFNRYGGDFSPNFSELVRTLDTDREYVKSHTKWSQRALEWEEKGKSADLLLRGSEFAIAQSWLQEAEQQKKQPVATVLQKEYITASWNAIAAARKQEKRQVFILRSLLGLVSTALVAAVGASVWAVSLYLKGERYQIDALSQISQQRFALNQNSFDALLKALEAGIQLKHSLGAKADPKIRAEVMTTLGQAVYWVREYNRLEGHKDNIQGVSFSPDGKMIATASYDKTVKLWNRDGSLIRTLEGHEGHTGGVLSVTFSPDNQMIATASVDKTVKLWSRDGKLLHTLNNGSNYVHSVSFSPDGKMLATASADKTVQLWNRDGKLLNTLKGHSAKVFSVSFSPDGQMIASASDDQTVRLWSQDGKLLHTLPGHLSGVYSVSFSPDSKTIATASADKTVKLWNRDGKVIQNLTGHTDEVMNVSFSPDGQTIATASKDNTVKLWNRNGKELTTLKGHSGQVNSLSFSPDGSILATSSNDKMVKLWQLKLPRLTILTGHDNRRVYKVAFSPDGNTIATANGDSTVKLWNRQGKVLTTLRGHKKRVFGVSFSPDGQTIASASKDNTVILWNRNGKLLRTLEGHKGWVYRVSFSPDGQTIASASADKTVILWSRNGKFLRSLKGHSNFVYGVSFSPDGKMIASASEDKTAILWNRDGKAIATLKGHLSGVYNANFSPDGKTIATVSEDNTAILWNRDGKFLRTLKGHNAAVGAVSFSPDGKTIATASDDHTVKLWNRDGTLITTLIGHTAEVTGVSFSPDSKFLASASWDNSAILWNVENLNLDSFIVRGCDWLHDYLKTNHSAPSDLCKGVGTQTAF